MLISDSVCLNHRTKVSGRTPTDHTGQFTFHHPCDLLWLTRISTRRSNPDKYKGREVNPSVDFSIILVTWCVTENSTSKGKLQREQEKGERISFVVGAKG